MVEIIKNDLNEVSKLTSRIKDNIMSHSKIIFTMKG